MQIEVCYARPEEQVIVKLKMPASATVQEAIAQSGICTRFSQIDLTRNPVGIFGKLRRLTDALMDGDRVEIYRELKMDAQASRHQRVAEARREKARAMSQPKPKVRSPN